MNQMSAVKTQIPASLWGSPERTRGRVLVPTQTPAVSQAVTRGVRSRRCTGRLCLAGGSR